MIDEIELGLDPAHRRRSRSWRSSACPTAGATRSSTLRRSAAAPWSTATARASCRPRPPGSSTTPGALLLGADVVRPRRPRRGHRRRHPRSSSPTRNRKRAKRWYSLRENAGATEPADHAVVLDDDPPTRASRSPAPRPPGTQTVVVWRGVRSHLGHRLRQPEHAASRRSGRPTPSTATSPPRGAASAAPTAPGAASAWSCRRPSDADHLTLIAPQDRLGTVRLTDVPRHPRRRSARRRRPSRPRRPAAPRASRSPLDGKPFQRRRGRDPRQRPRRRPGRVRRDRHPGRGGGGARPSCPPRSSTSSATASPTRRCRSCSPASAPTPPSPCAPTRSRPCAGSSTCPRRSTSASPAPPASTPPRPIRCSTTCSAPGPSAWGVRGRQHRPPGRRPRRPGLVACSTATSAPRGRPRSRRSSGRPSTCASPEPVTLDALELDVVADGRHSLPTGLRAHRRRRRRRSTSTVPPITSPAADGRGTVNVRLPLPETITATQLAGGGDRASTSARPPTGRRCSPSRSRSASPRSTLPGRPAAALRPPWTPAAGTTSSRSTARRWRCGSRATPRIAARPAGSSWSAARTPWPSRPASRSSAPPPGGVTGLAVDRLVLQSASWRPLRRRSPAPPRRPRTRARCRARHGHGDHRRRAVLARPRREHERRVGPRRGRRHGRGPAPGRRLRGRLARHPRRGRAPSPSPPTGRPSGPSTSPCCCRPPACSLCLVLLVCGAADVADAAAPRSVARRRAAPAPRLAGVPWSGSRCWPPCVVSPIAAVLGAGVVLLGRRWPWVGRGAARARDRRRHGGHHRAPGRPRLPGRRSSGRPGSPGPTRRPCSPWSCCSAWPCRPTSRSPADRVHGRDRSRRPRPRLRHLQRPHLGRQRLARPARRRRPTTACPSTSSATAPPTSPTTPTPTTAMEPLVADQLPDEPGRRHRVLPRAPACCSRSRATTPSASAASCSPASAPTCSAPRAAT